MNKKTIHTTSTQPYNKYSWSFKRGVYPCGNNENKKYFYHTDHLGSSSWITDASGNVNQHLAYLPYGEQFIDERNDSRDIRFKFIAKERDPEIKHLGADSPNTTENKLFMRQTGLDYFGARYYSSGLSVWLSVDALAGKYPNISSYNYVFNNSINGTDPDGRSGILKNKRRKVVVVSKFYFYGNVSRKEVRQIKKEIKYQWNSANGQVIVDGKVKEVKFRIRGRKVSKSRAIKLASNNKSSKNNFIKVEQGERGKRSFMQLNGNAGIWYKSDELGSSTTAAHEVGHGWGYYNPQGTTNGAHSPGNLKGTGRADIMATRGTLVDPQFRYFSWKTTGYEGVDPFRRQANQHDINGIFRNIYIQGRRIKLGRATNTIY